MISLLGCQTNRPTRVGHVIDKDRHSALHVADKRHLLDLVLAFSLLVD